MTPVTTMGGHHNWFLGEVIPFASCECRISGHLLPLGAMEAGAGEAGCPGGKERWAPSVSLLGSPVQYVIPKRKQQPFVVPPEL
jgi:hypothetical protein